VRLDQHHCPHTLTALFQYETDEQYNYYFTICSLISPT